MMENNNSTECCFINYETRCECAEDDRCGCSFPNNIKNHVDCDNLTLKKESNILEKGENEMPQDAICYCAPKACDCRIEH